MRFANLDNKGSITVEASIVVPLFFLLVFSLLYLFPVIGEQLQVQKELVSAAKKYEGYEISQPLIQLDSGRIHNLKWDIDGDYGVCICKWNKSIPMLGDWFFVVTTQRMPVRKYTGLSMVPEETAEDDTYVYLAENGTVYHLMVTCTYLHLGIREISAERLQTERNRSGGIYKPCERCMKNIQVSDGVDVFITPYGDRYHCTKDCSGLRRTVRKVKKSEVGNLPPCSKCGI
ncbi:MAG: hypothetical protein J1E62_08625 [Lachnospiraceae bacterium]|nr:hypothetical protein [Lachnospiraceae bacterium]